MSAEGPSTIATARVPSLDDGPTRLYQPMAPATVVTPRHRAPHARVAVLALALAALGAVAGLALWGYASTSSTRSEAAREAPARPSHADATPASRAPEPGPTPQAEASSSAAPLAQPASPSEAARHLVRGDLARARDAYRALDATGQAEAVFGEIARRLDRAVEARCARLRSEGRPCE